MPSIKLLFFLAVWRRPEITEICFMGLNRLKRETDFECSFLAVISEESMIPLCEKYGVDWCFHENLPLGKKKNFGIAEALKRDFDYLVELGSDDLLKNDLLEVYRPYFNKETPMIGVNCYAMIDSGTGEVKMYRQGTSATFGVGRCIKRSVIEENAPLWPDNISKGMDNASHILLARRGVHGRRILIDRPMAVDLKSDVNIWSYGHIVGSEIDFDLVVEGLSQEEITAIKALQNVEA